MQQINRYSGALSGNFEYTETWSEAHRHACEVDEIARLPQQWDVDARLQGIRAKRGEAAMARIARDVSEHRSELARQGKLRPPSAGGAPAPAKQPARASKPASDAIASLF